VDAPPLERGRIAAVDREQQRRLDWARTERVHTDVLARELYGELSRHRQDGALRGRIGDLRGRGAEDGDERGDVDDRAAAALDQPREAVPAAEEDALRVHVLDALPGLDGRVEDGRVVRRRDACVVVEHVDPAEPLDGRGHHLLDRVLVGDVDPGGECLPGAHRHGLLGRVEHHVRGADTGALGREQDRRLTPHAASGAGDHAHLSVQPSRHLSPPSSRRRS
jgi:hypothetical protein